MAGIWKEINLGAIKKAETAAQPDHKGPEVLTVFHNRFMSVFSFHVTLRDWKVLSSTNRYLCANIVSLTEETIATGKIYTFLDVSGRQVILPFMYHQSQGSACIRSVCETQKMYVSILGQFVPSVHDSFGFKIVVVSGKIPTRFRWLNWENYSAIRKAFQITS